MREENAKAERDAICDEVDQERSKNDDPTPATVGRPRFSDRYILIIGARTGTGTGAGDGDRRRRRLRVELHV